MHTKILAALIFALAGSVSAAQTGSASRTVLEGVFTVSQAERGRAAYTTHCGDCHKADLDGEGEMAPLRGEAFMERWRDYDLQPLFHLVKTEMPPLRFRTPQTAPLSDEMYVDILAYMLQANSFPSGTRELTSDMLDDVRIVGFDGPQPPPNFALVLSVGCLTRTPDSRWMLTNATDPIRATMPDITTPDELEASQALPSGTREYRLADFAYLGDAFNPERFRAQRIQVKGYLIRQPEFERISVTSVDSVAFFCE
jgi:mono/diheme cytochrome c family protein